MRELKLSTPRPVLLLRTSGLGALAFIYCTTPDFEGGLGMSASSAGAILLVQGLVGVVLGPLFGHFIDATEKKRQWLAGALSCTALTFLLMLAWEAPGWVGTVLVCQGAIAAIYPPAINSISLGVVGKVGLPNRAARNEIFKVSAIGGGGSLS